LDAERFLPTWTVIGDALNVLPRQQTHRKQATGSVLLVDLLHSQLSLRALLRSCEDVELLELFRKFLRLFDLFLQLLRWQSFCGLVVLALDAADGHASSRVE